MARSSISLAGLLPKPKYLGEEEEIPTYAQTKGPRIIGAKEAEAQQLVLKVYTIFYVR